MGSTERAPRSVTITQNGIGKLVSQEELDHPDWEISADDRRNRETAIKMCAAHHADLRRFQTKLCSYILLDEERSLFLR